MDSDKLKGRMREKKFTQNKLAQSLGITPQSLNAKINGRSKFTLDEAVEIVDTLEIEDPKDIFFAKKIPNTQRKIG